MKRREFIRTLGAGAAAVSAPVLSNYSNAESKKPNFLFLFTDDQTFRSIGSLNNPAVKTPNLDRLVSRGVTFTHTFNQGSWSGAVCICSRAMLNTGMYIYHARQGIGGKDGPRVPLWGETLGAAGYETFMTGKWHNGDPALRKSFKTVGPYGGGMLPSTDMDGDAYNRPAPGNHWSPFDTSRKGHWREQDDGRVIHSSRLWADAAIEYLKKRKKGQTNPFFMYVAFHAPHDPRQSPKKYVDMYPLDSIEIPPNFMPEHLFEQGERYTLRDERLAPFPRSKEAVKVHLQEYYAIISHADAQIGRILDALEKTGEADNTYILFSADHGLAVGQHGLMGKQNQYDHSVRMPLIISGPGLEPGKTIDSLVYLHSLYATTCELAGIEIPESVEFPSLMPLLRGEKKTLHHEIFGSYKDFQRMVRTEEFKLIRYPQEYRTQLFNVKEDPWEIKNLAHDPKYADTIADLNQRLKRLQKKVGDELALD